MAVKTAHCRTTELLNNKDENSTAVRLSQIDISVLLLSGLLCMGLLHFVLERYLLCFSSARRGSLPFSVEKLRAIRELANTAHVSQSLIGPFLGK